MEKVKFNCLMNAVVSVALSIVTLIILRQMPGVFNFLLPTIEGFAIAMVLTTVLPLERWGATLAQKMKLPEMLGSLVLIAFANVTCITFILNAQSNSLTAASILTWLKGLPIFYLTAIVVSMITARLYMGKAEERKNNK